MVGGLNGRLKESQRHKFLSENFLERKESCNFAAPLRDSGIKFKPNYKSQKMATKIRLQRGGRKGYAFYSIVIADARAPRDGRFTEKIGTYNPNTNPATVDLNFDRALYWVETGAQPTDTVRNILSNEGVYLMKHLRGGVRKGAFGEDAVQTKFDAWKAQKVKGFEAEAKKTAEAKVAAAAKELEAEKKINEAIAKKVADKKAAAAAAKAEAEAAANAEASVEETAEA